MSPTLLLLLLTLASVTAKLSETIKQCSDVSCDADADYFKYLDQEPQRIYQWMSAGLPQIFWDAVRDGSLFKQATLSKECERQVTSISDGMRLEEEWAYKFIDSSGKTPSGIFRSTLTAIGDYDECLRIEHESSAGRIAGKYCMIDLFPIVVQNSTTKKMDLSRASVFQIYPFWNALCLPTGCSEQEIQSSLQVLLRPFPIRAKGDISCDTSADTSLSNRLLNLTIKQLIALAFVSSVVGLVLACTAHQMWNYAVLNMKDDLPAFVTQLPFVPQPAYLKSLSILESTKKIFIAKPTEYDVVFFDCVKLFVIWTGTLAHLMVNVEAPLSTATMDKHDILKYIISSPETQPLMNDAGLVTTSFISGVAVFLIAFPVAAKGKLPYMFTIIDRFIRFLPAMMCLTALEFVWPLVGSGPFFKRVAAANLDKCSRNWWLNLLFINNYFIDGIDICGGHTFYSSIDMQLFIIGIAGVYMFTRSAKAGITFSIAMILLGSLKMAHTSFVHDTTGTLYTPLPSATKIENYFSYVTVQVATYLPAYFLGMLVAYGHVNDMLPNKVDGLLGHLKWFVVFNISQTTVNFVAVAYNSFQLIPHSLTFIVVVLTRTFQMCTVTLVFMYAMAFKPSGQKGKTDENSSSDAGLEQRAESFNFFKGICRLSFAVYMSNYLYIRTEYFTRRFLIHNHMYWIVHRMISSMLFIYITAFVFQVLFLSPFEAIRVHVLKSLRSPRESKKSE